MNFRYPVFCRLVHWGPLYRTIHKKHHEWTAPMGIISVYAHPIEYIIANSLPIMIGPVVMRSHILTTWVWYGLAMFTTVVHHSGYHLPWLLSPEFHDYHHLKYVLRLIFLSQDSSSKMSNA